MADAIETLRDLLENGPLYSSRKYVGEARFEEYLQYGSQSKMRVPNRISRSCIRCQQLTQWSGAESVLYRTECLYSLTFQCRNCGIESIIYYLHWQEEDGGVIRKIGQFPPLDVDIPKELKLSPNDTDLYKKALRCRNFSFGLGAVAYLRRVVENRMNELIELVAEACKSGGEPLKDQVELERLRDVGTFEAKAKFCAQQLPKHLRPNGHNPFDVILSFASDGVHEGSEEECLEKFDKVRYVFEHLFRNLKFEAEEAKAYMETLTSLASNQSSKKPSPVDN